MKSNAIIMVVVVAVIALGAGFFGGMQYQKMQPGTSNSQYAGGALGRNRMGRFGGNAGMRPVVGQIISSDQNSITVKMMDGSTKIVIVSKSASINKAAQATISDLTTGETVAVFGTQNSDGSVTAQNIQINPQMRMRQETNVTPSPTQ